MTKGKKHAGLAGLLIVVVAAIVVVATQGVDPTGRATGGLLPSGGMADIQFDLADHVTVHPAPGASDVPPYWDGNEVPQPPEPPGGYPSGPVVTVQIQEGEIDIVDGRIMIQGTDEVIPSTLLLPDNDPKLPSGTAGLIPHQPLAAITTYRVVFSDAAGEVVAEWPFTTGASVCDPTAQDCGRGQGCYLVEGSPVCIWAGTLMVDEPCDFLNACAPGLLCFRGRCHPYCDSTASADPDVACKSQCPQGGQDITGAEDSPAKACLADSCLREHVTCPEGEACYRYNELYLCATAGTAAPEAACQYPNDCAPGSTCIGLNGSFACRTLCDGPGRPVCDDACPGGYRTLGADPLVRHCR
jgi:hypothetical protein